jgi:recombinational DNA repair ATPase RecF
VRLLRLEIRHFRGIQELDLAPGGENLVLWGTNGSGKSSVADAIDFVLTGRIPRLTGEGTAGPRSRSTARTSTTRPRTRA